MNIYSSSAVLVLILVGYKDAEGYMPGKLFEYVATGLPILGVGPIHGDAASLLDETQAGKMFSQDDQEGIVLFLFQGFEKFKESSRRNDMRSMSKFSRRALTEDLVKLLK
jgi:hypothetical protein